MQGRMAKLQPKFTGRNIDRRERQRDIDRKSESWSQRKLLERRSIITSQSKNVICVCFSGTAFRQRLSQRLEGQVNEVLVGQGRGLAVRRAALFSFSFVPRPKRRHFFPPAFLHIRSLPGSARFDG
uniref:Uncharacterized protein n=1 Tax=Odontella aurita TaxID=265563 RepID=A0A6U6ECS0_9STRA|mmetsp:Transcript_25069/g.73416  ORF Transcript_25069/g.73416 Transcript_25069/m.73416 type:complete len:126 (+) Transcript_25069:365-742(+)